MTFTTKLRDGRISLPTRLRTLAGVADGDPVNVTLVKGRFVVTPAQRVAPTQSRKQQRESFLSTLRDTAPASLKAMWADAKRTGTDKLNASEIDRIIAEVRAEHAPKKTAKRPVR